MEVSQWKRYGFRKSGVEHFKLDVSRGERTIEERQSSLFRIAFPSFPRDIQQYLRKSIRERGDRNNRGIKVMRTERRRRLSSISTRRSTSTRRREKLSEETPSNRRCRALIADERECEAKRVKRKVLHDFRGRNRSGDEDEDSFLSEDPRLTSSR